MFSQLSNVLPSLKSKPPEKTGPAVELPPAKDYAIESSKESPARTTKHLIKLNHSNHAILYNGLEFYNHIPHLLSTAYLLGASAEQINELYESESKEQEPWTASPSEISTDDWRDFLGKREYQRAWVDFFEDELVRHGYEWEKVVETYIFSGEKPLVNSLVAGIGHPLIHLGYAYEMSSHVVAMEALAMAATSYSTIHTYIENPANQEPPHVSSGSQPLSLLEHFDKIREDTRYDSIVTSPGYSNIPVLLSQHHDLMNEWLQAWPVTTDPTSQFRSIQHTSTALFLATSDKPYSFFFLHLLTSSHALRVLFPVVPTQHHTSLLRQWWLLAIVIYAAQLRPAIDLDRIKRVNLQGRDWEWVRKSCMSGSRAADVHYIKGVRTLAEMGKACGDQEDDEEFYLKAAVRLIDDFDGWGGFS